MGEQSLGALAAAGGLALVHVFAGRLRFLEGVPRNRWLSAFGGISVAYVFAHLMPELAEGQQTIDADGVVRFVEHHVYLLALGGLALFYGVEQHSLASRRANAEDRTNSDAFWLSIGSFALYNAVVGYLLLRGELESSVALVLYTVALAVHFVVNDFGLREHHKDAYRTTGRWILAAAVLVGWAVGVLTEVPERAIAAVVAFIAGGVVLNVLKEELPGERQARFGPFLAGAVLYAALLQVS